MLFIRFYCFYYFFFFFFFNDTATTEIYTLSLHDALPISSRPRLHGVRPGVERHRRRRSGARGRRDRSEEHTSELQSHSDLVCRLLLEKKKKKKKKKNKKKIQKIKIYIGEEIINTQIL